MSRWGGGLIRLSGRDWGLPLATELENFLRRLFQFQAIAQKTPGAATQIQAGVVASAGTTATAEPLAKDNHQHSIETAASGGLSNSNSEGSGTALLRASAGIKRDVRVKQGGSDFATRNALDFAAASFTLTDDSGGDRVIITAVGLSSVDLEYLCWTV